MFLAIVEQLDDVRLSERSDPNRKGCRSRYWNLLGLAAHSAFKLVSILESDLGPFKK